MSRLTYTGLVLVLLLLAGSGVWWMLATKPPSPQHQPIDHLTDTTTIRWTNEDVAVIEAGDSLDAFSALGYVHGMNRGWTVTLWRQTARGALNRWFGTGVAPLDHHTRQLGLAENAKTAFRQLPATDKRRLRAYTRGLNAALQSNSVRKQDPFVLHDVTPAPWEPWHTLAIERLLAWLATPPLDVPPSAPEAVSDFRRVDLQLRRWLHLHGWDRSLAWAAHPPADSARAVLFQRHVLGASASSIVQEVLLNQADAPQLAGASLPGTPFFPTGIYDDTAWASLLRSTARLDRVPLDSSKVSTAYERLNPSGGDEELVRIRRLDGALFLASDTTSPSPSPDSTVELVEQTSDPPSAPSRTAWVVHWPGLSSESDVSAWLRRADLHSEPSEEEAFESSADDAREPTFRLFAGDGLRVSSDGNWTVLGSPSIVVRDSARRHIVVGNSPWTRHQAESLRAHYTSSSSLDVRNWTASDSSTWATHLLSHSHAALDRFRKTHPQFRDAVTYLQNWDHTYTPTSIGATIFDQWMRSYRGDLGHLPMPSDTARYFASYRQSRALLPALDSLRSRFGPDVRRWRWERAVSDRRYFPVWSADSLVNDDLRDLGSTQYAPLNRRARGHPSALAGGASLVDSSSARPPSPTSWEGWTTLGDTALVARRHHYDPTAFFARTKVQRDRPSPVPLSPDSTTHTTTLVPPP